MGIDSMGSEKLNSKIKILVVEDNLLSQKLASLMLAEWGFRYEILSNGKLAINDLAISTYDLILMDIHMPELDGYDATAHIREKLKLRLPIIAMTAHAMPGEKEKCLKAGMTDYITKPIDEEELFNLITKYLFSNIIQKEET